MHFHHSEWELLQEEIILKNSDIFKFNSSPQLLDKIKRINIYRNENYNINLDIEIETRYWKTIENSAEKWNIEIESYNYFLNLKSCTLTQRTLSLGEENYLKLKFKVYEVEAIYKNMDLNNKHYLKEHYINSTQNSYFFRRGTSFKYNENFEKIRDLHENKKIKLENRGKEQNILDTLLIELKDYNLILEKTPEAFPPYWSNNINIEYQKMFNIPSKEIREKIKEIISLLMGRYLLNVGETYFDKNWNKIKEISRTPNI